MIHPTVTIPVSPMGKPRMTQRDKWKKRPAVLRYHAFKDSLRTYLNGMPHLMQLLESGNVVGLSWNAYLPLPESWPKRKKALFAGSPHRSKPDRDNIDKAILDAIFPEDSGVASGHIHKFWDDGRGARIELTIETMQPANA